MWSWLTKLWSSLKKVFDVFIKQALNDAAQAFIAKFKEQAIAIVKDLDAQTLKSAEKREIAFKRIKDAVVAAGATASDSLINTLIELALQYVKNTTTK